MTYLQAAHCPDGESPAHEVAEIPIYPAAIRSYAHDPFLNENEGADVADLQPFSTRAKMVLEKVVLQGNRCRPFTLCRNPGLAGGQKRQEQDKACKGNERSQDLCSAHGVPATYQLLARRC